MRVGIIGRSSLMMNTIHEVRRRGYEVSFIITSKEAPEYEICHQDFESIAIDIGCPYLYVDSSNKNQIEDFIQSCCPADVCLSVNYSGVIPEKIIKLFSIGILNAHLGDLPKYRGNATGAWAILNGEERVGLCIHKMIGGELDSGDIICKNYLEILDNTRVGELYEWMESEIPKQYIVALKRLHLDSKYVLEKQSKNPKFGLRTFSRQPKDGRVSFDKISLFVNRLINASSEPFSGAFAFFGDKIIIIWRSEILLVKDNYQFVPGQIIEINDLEGYVVVGCGDQTYLKLLDVEIDKKRGAPNMFFNSTRNRLT